nr:sugar ABC transporter ATP-binding protein [Rhodovibrio salinarum]
MAVQDVTKRFGPTVALNEASFAVRSGHVHALLGENGAGKSTCVKVLSGLITPDSGRIEIDGSVADLASPRDAHRLGIQTAFQEITLVPDLSVAQNMLLPYEPTRYGQLRRKAGMRAVAETLEHLGLGDVDLRAEVRSLDLPQRQKIEIAKAVARGPKILLLDEPTSALSGADVDWLGGLIEQLRADGVTIIFISHRMPEVRLFCDSLSILRNGSHVGTFETGEISDEDVVERVIGRSLATAFPERQSKTMGEVLLSGRQLANDGRLDGISFDLHAGEILGVSALQGMGQQELFMSLFGMDTLSGGHVEIGGRETTIASPNDAVRSHLGVSLVPEDRKTEALFQHLPGQPNVSLPVLDRFARFGWIDTDLEARAVDSVLAQVNVHPRALYTPVTSFSGGNQQKIALAKWLLTECRVLLMFDPTRGVDVGTKHEIYQLMHDFVGRGGAILFYSTEIPELVNLCDRVLAVYRGRVTDEIAGDDLSEQNILRSVIGHEAVSQQAGSQQAGAQ